MENNWPASIEQPQLPDNLHWVCLEKTTGHKSREKWWIRITKRQSTKQGLKFRYLDTNGFFDTPQDAINFALSKITC